jgi:hypothetical protein
MYTTADENLDKAARHIHDAITHLVEIVVNHCHGHNDYKPEYKNKIKDSLRQLMDIRDELNRDI